MSTTAETTLLELELDRPSVPLYVYWYCCCATRTGSKRPFIYKSCGVTFPNHQRFIWISAFTTAAE